jgi:hypothetical protein
VWKSYQEQLEMGTEICSCDVSKRMIIIIIISRFSSRGLCRTGVRCGVYAEEIAIRGWSSEIPDILLKMLVLQNNVKA